MTFGSPIDRRAALRRLSLALGGVATAPLASGLLSGCRTPSGDALAAYDYRTLDAGQRDLLAALVDQILPATDTPGAAEAGVPQFVDLMLTDWYAPEERDGFLAGLADVDRRAEGSFVDLSDDARATLVATLDAQTFGPADAASAPDEDVVEAGREGTAQADEEAENEVAGMQGDLGNAMSDSTGSGGPTEINTGEGTVAVGGAAEPPPFYRQLKELTLAGYYTSEVGATQELQWLAAPGRYEADLPLAKVGRAWA